MREEVFGGPKTREIECTPFVKRDGGRRKHVKRVGGGTD